MKTKTLLALLLLTLGLSACNLPQPVDPSATPLPSPTFDPLFPTPTLTTTPPSTATPLARIESGDRALFNGDWELALQEYQLALDSNYDPEIQTAAMLGIGRTRYLSGDYSGALGDLRNLVDNYPYAPHRAQAFFHLARVYDALGQYAQAADAYGNYWSLRPGLIDAYLFEWQADSYAAAGSYQTALDTYQLALEAPSLSNGLGIEIKVAGIYDTAGDYETAIALYANIRANTNNDYVKAQMNLRMGQAYLSLGQPEEAYTLFQDSVANYPLSYDTYIGLVILVEAGVPVNELSRGLVDYYAGQYAVAIAAFDRYLQAYPDDPTALFYRGLSFLSLSEAEQAIISWDKIIELHPQDRFWDDAHDEKAYAQWAYLDEYNLATDTLLSFVARAPGHPSAAEYLSYAARIAERGGYLTQSAELWERVANEYPASGLGYRSLFLSGISRYRIEDYGGALVSFQSSMEFAATSGDQAALYLWMGKCHQALGNAEAARQSWDQATAADPTGYYSERARDLLLDRPAFTPPQVYDLAFDQAAERADAETWLRTTFAISAEVGLSDPGSLRNDVRFQRGDELWALGQYGEARTEFESLRLSVQHDPADTFRLAGYLHELGLYRPAIFAARGVLNLAGMDDAGTLSAPIYFNHIRFGIYYGDLILPAAQAYGLHPLFIFSVVRQESLFEGFITSTAAARGLMQIIPSTGQSIADRSGWPPNYTSDDLYRPLVSVTFGTDYLSRQHDTFDGDPSAALAAYNGGPGNSNIWWNLADGDPDLFLEIIRFGETRRYVRGVYEIFAIYRRIYDRTP